MTDASDRYDRLAQQLADTIDAVPDDAWDNQSPCEDWNARDVVRHVVDTHAMFLGFIGQQLGDIPSVDDDPAASFAAARGRIKDALDDPTTAKQTYEGFTGTTSFEDSVDRFISFDLNIHRWDLGRAVGRDERLDPSEVTQLRALAEQFGDGLRGPNVCGPALDPPAGADAQTELLAFLGRKAW